jgi:nicotinate-nucleotide adenylyltransferase
MSKTEKKRTIALLGGSFNPPHNGHLQAALYAHEHIKADELWLMVTPQNPLKEKYTYAPLQDRVRMCQLMAAPYSSWLKVTDIETHLKTKRTADTLFALKKAYPDTQFIWVMGADNLKTFHKWYQWQSIMKNFPIAVIDRKYELNKALQSPAALYGNKLRLNDAAELHEKTGWYVLNNPVPKAYHARKIAKKIEKGELVLPSLFNELSGGHREKSFKDVAKYIVTNNLYRKNA